MARVLLTQNNVENHICRKTSSLYVNRDMIIPPGVKDYLQTIGITIQYGPQPAIQVVPAVPVEAKQVATTPPAASELPSSVGELAALTKRVVAILQEEYQITDKETLQKLCLQVVKKINI